MYLKGKNIKPSTASDAKKLIGKKVCYLTSADIDKSGRGYFFPRYGVIADVKGKNIAIDDADNLCLYMSEIEEMIEV
jgi:ribosomal protein L35AE/L33A